MVSWLVLSSPDRAVRPSFHSKLYIKVCLRARFASEVRQEFKAVTCE